MNPFSKSLLLLSLFTFALFTSASFAAEGDVSLSGELKKWHKITLTFEGPEVSEMDEENPFLVYRLNALFWHPVSGKEYLVPGYFAADGNAANTGAASGDKWRVHFRPDETGEWRYKVSFRKSSFAAISDLPATGGKKGSAGFMDGKRGSFMVKASDKEGRDLRAKGRLQVTGGRYLRFAENEEYYLKCGPDAPENLLAFEDFDGSFHNDGHYHKGTFEALGRETKLYEAHVKDWKKGDPTWKQGKGKGLIGAVNYLASEGMNSISFITMNIAGDDRNVFPYVDYDTYDRFDVSKLDQWEIVFEHASKLGFFLHFKTLEVENQGLLDGGGVGLQRKLYYRELIARFGHHLALNWNISEESGEWVPNNPTPPQFKWQRLASGQYFADHDPYGHHIVIHNGVWYDDLLGPDSPYTGASLQTHRPNFELVHGDVVKLLKESKAAGKQWAVAVDEPGDAQHALLPDAEDPEHDEPRQNALWGALLGGAWGLEWYFGYQHAHSDLTCEDFRSRDLFWDQCRYALEFFKKNEIPVWSMESSDHLIVDNPPVVRAVEGDYCLAREGEVYVLFNRDGDEVKLKIEEGDYSVQWYNPREGGSLKNGSVKTLTGGGEVSIGTPPTVDGKDWVALILRK